jgi:predicted CXXCH cytochrome family protein
VWLCRTPLFAQKIADSKDQCIACHSSLGDKLQKPVDLYAVDVHFKKGVSCAGCHGGDPKNDDMEASMSKAAGFIGVPKGDDITAMCAKCHSNADYMKRFDSTIPTDQQAQLMQSVHWKKNTASKGMIVNCVTCHSVHNIRPVHDAESAVAGLNIIKTCTSCHSSANVMKAFNPSLSVDQLEKYKTSVHGQKVFQGNTKVAQCASCHGSHGIRQAVDAKSLVNAKNIPATCAKCHADAAYMKPYGIPTDQYQKFVNSVHGKALLEKGDMFAPSCNKCHGNHGAVPPGVASISNVCGTCHALNAELFSASPHKKVFDEKKIPECDVCHSNHDVQSPTDDMLGVGQQSTCMKCHQDNNSTGYKVAGEMKMLIDSLQHNARYANGVITEAEQKGMEVSDAKFDFKDIRQILIETRTVMHKTDIEKYRETIKAGFDITNKSKTAGEEAIKDYYFRRTGLGISTLIITVLAVGLYLKIRKIERKQQAKT